MGACESQSNARHALPFNDDAYSGCSCQDRQRDHQADRHCERKQHHLARHRFFSLVNGPEAYEFTGTTLRPYLGNATLPLSRRQFVTTIHRLHPYLYENLTKVLQMYYEYASLLGCGLVCGLEDAKRLQCSPSCWAGSPTAANGWA